MTAIEILTSARKLISHEQQFCGWGDMAANLKGGTCHPLSKYARRWSLDGALVKVLDTGDERDTHSAAASEARRLLNLCRHVGALAALDAAIAQAKVTA